MQRLVSRPTWIAPLIALLACVAGLFCVKPLYAQDKAPLGNSAALTTTRSALPSGWQLLAGAADASTDAEGYTHFRKEINSDCQFTDHNYSLDLPVDPARMSDIRLTMSNFDVDYYDPQECEGGPEFDDASLNGKPLGILGGANDSWSINSWTIDPNGVVKGPNRVFIDTDATGTGCWCVAVGYIDLQAKVDFQIVDQSPADNEQNRDFHADKVDPTVTFSGDVKASTVTNQTVILSYRDAAGQMQDVPGTPIVQAPNKILFVPKADLFDGVRYYVTIIGGPNGVKSAAGQPLPATRTWSFWTVPNFDLTDSFDYGDGSGSHCPPTAAPCKGVELAVFQVARNAPMIPNKDSVARLYLRWKRHSEVMAGDQIKELTVDVKLDVTPGGGAYQVTASVKRPDQYSQAEIENAANTINIYHKPPNGFHYSVQVTPQPQANTTPVVFNASLNLPNAGKSPSISFNHYFLKNGDWASGVPSGVQSGALSLLLAGSQVTVDMFPVLTVNAVNKGDLVLNYTYTGNTVNRASCGTVKEVLCPMGGGNVTTTEIDCVDFKTRSLLGTNKIQIITIPQNMCPNVGGVAFGHTLFMPPTNNAVAIAHEIGHAYGISTANNPNPGHRNSPDGIEGFQVRTKTNRSQTENPAKAASLMHTGPIADPSSQWTHNADYATLLGTVSAAEVEAASVDAGPFLMVSGLVDVGANSATIDPLFLQAGAAAPPPTGPCKAELFDGSSALLSSVAFAPGVKVFALETSGVEQEGSTPDVTEATGPQPFALTLPWNESAQQLKISCNNTPITTINRTATPPSADFSDLADGALLSNSVTVNWAGSDGDSPLLFYQLQFAADGTHYIPLSALITATTYTIDTTALPSGNKGKLRLLVSDGFTSAFAEGKVTINNDLSVLAQSPADFDENVALNTTVQAMFNTPIDPHSLSFAAFSLTGGDTPPTGTLTLSPDHRVLTFTPRDPLQANAYYTARVTTKLKDSSGRSLPFDSVWSFRVISDTTPPLIDRFDPGEDQVDVPLNAFITVHVSEPLDSSTTNAAITVVDSANHAVEGSTSYYDRDLNLVFLPKEPLKAHTTYKVTVHTTIKDENGNLLPKPLVWSFTTGATTSDQVRIVGNYGELAEDDNGDGLYDKLTVYVDVLSLGGFYNLNPRLIDKNGELIEWAKADFGDAILEGLLNQGLHRLALVFDGPVIRAHQVDGPYFIDSLNYYNEPLFGTPTNFDIRFGVFQTLPYSVTAFDGVLSFKPLPDRTLEWNTARENAWNLRDYTLSLAAPITTVTYSIVGNTDPRVGVSIDADNNIDIHPAANTEAESTITIEARDPLGNTGDGSFRVRVQKPAASVLVAPSLLVVAPNVKTKITVEIRDQFDHLYTGGPVKLTFSNQEGTAHVTPTEVTTSNGRASITYDPGPDSGEDSILIQTDGGLSASIIVATGNKANYLPNLQFSP